MSLAEVLKYLFLAWIIISVCVFCYWITNDFKFETEDYLIVKQLIGWGAFLFSFICLWKGSAYILILLFKTEGDGCSFVAGFILCLFSSLYVFRKYEDYKKLRIKKDVFEKLKPFLFNTSTEFLNDGIEKYKELEAESKDAELLTYIEVVDTLENIKNSSKRK